MMPESLSVALALDQAKVFRVPSEGTELGRILSELFASVKAAAELLPFDQRMQLGREVVATRSLEVLAEHPIGDSALVASVVRSVYGAQDRPAGWLLRGPSHVPIQELRSLMTRRNIGEVGVMS